MAHSKAISLPTQERPTERDYSLRRQVFWLALPAVGEQVLNTLVGLTDHFLVGHLSPAVAAAQGYDRATALAAVGISNLIVWIATTLFMAVAVGATAIVARRIGAGEGGQANHTLGQALLLSLAVGAVGTAVALGWGHTILGGLGASAEVVAVGNGFLRIVALSFLPAAFMFAGTAALRGAGDTRSPLYLMVIVNVVNMVVSWLLVNGTGGFPALGVEGAAIGNALSRTLGGALLLAMLASGRMRLQLARAWRPDPTSMGRILRIGLPAAGEQLVFQVAILVMTRFITDLGTAAYAAHHVTINIESLSFLPGYGFSIAATALVGQALGAGDPGRAERAAWEALRQGGLLMSVLGLMMVLWPAALVRWIAPEPAVVAQAVWPLRLAGLGQPALAFAFILIGALRGAGDTVWPFWMRLVTAWGVRVPLVILFLRITPWGLGAVWLAMLVDFIAQGLLAAWRFRSGRWQGVEV